MLSVSEAKQEILSRIRPGAAIRVPLHEAAGRVLRETVVAERDAPPFDRVMMDGFAVAGDRPRAEGWRIVGLAAAGHPPPYLNAEDEAVEVTTGCPLPPGTRCIVPVEDTRREGDRLFLNEGASLQPGRFIHRQASDGAAGRIVLKSGIRLGPAELAIAATEGRDSLCVSVLPRIRLLSTGDEIVPPGQALRPEQIHGSHAAALGGLFAGADFAQRHAMDDPEALQTALAELLEQSDVLLITGGVSRGSRDFVPEALYALGVEKIFHRVAQKPGKPLWFGMRGNTLVFGLPGNPNSALICARRYVVPAVEVWCGAAPPENLRLSVEGDPVVYDDLTHFMPVRIQDGALMLCPAATSGSLHALAGSSGFVEIPPAPSDSSYTYFHW